MKIFNPGDVLFKIPALLLRGRFRFEFKMLPYEARNIPLKKSCQLFLAGLNQYLLPAKPLGYPVIAKVEPANYCNLTCPLCLTTSITKSRPRNILTLETFKQFIDECGDYLLLLILWNWGEPFLNPGTETGGRSIWASEASRNTKGKSGPGSSNLWPTRL